jgi:hypothetical protein
MEKDKKKIIAGVGILGAGLIGYLATRKKGAPPVLEVTLSNLAITPTTVFPGDPVTISVLATNHSDSALDATINLKGDFTDSQSLTLEAGTSQTVTFTVTPTIEKTYHVSVDSLSGSFVCTSAPHGDIQLSDLVIFPTSCIQLDTVTISVTATNYGDVNEVMAVTLHLTGSKYNDTSEPVQQIILEPGKSRIVTFTFQPTVAQIYTVTANGLSGSFVVNPAPTWPGWTPSTLVSDITATPTILYLGQTVKIVVGIQGPWPATYPMNIEATINIDGITLSDIFNIDFINPGLLFTYTPTSVGEYTVTAQDKSATFTVLANPTETYYSPLGGTRMPLATDIVIPGVPAFTAGGLGQTYSWPGGDLKYSDIVAMTDFGSFPTRNPLSTFPLWYPFSAIPQITDRLVNAQPVQWNPANAQISNYIIEVSWSRQMASVIVMATEYQCKQYWDTKDELANVIAKFIRSKQVLGFIAPSDWLPLYSVTCPVCGGSGRVPTQNPSRSRRCRYCNGTGKIWLIDLWSGLRDWDPTKAYNFFVGSYYNYTYTFQIKCPYDLKYWVTGRYSSDPGVSGELDAARFLIHHIEQAHPDHPLTEPAWF